MRGALLAALAAACLLAVAPAHAAPLPPLAPAPIAPLPPLAGAPREAPSAPAQAPAEEPSPEPSAPLTPDPVVLAAPDDADQASLLTSLARTRAYLNGLRKQNLTLLGRTIPVERFRRTAARFEELVQTRWGTVDFDQAVQQEFEWITPQGPVRFTGYHLPMLQARLDRDAAYRFPVYGVPADLVVVNLGAFKPALAGSVIAGRLKGNTLVPYYSRAEIEGKQVLAGRGLELAWVADGPGLASLMIQGSGLLQLEDGRTLHLNYAGQNGGGYIFFKLAQDGPFGVDGIPLTAGRAIATDKRYFPSGAISYIRYPRARFAADGRLLGTEPGGRFVVDQDTGGAIQGPARVDLFWGGGPEAARRAAILNGDGSLAVLLLKEAL